MGRGGKEAGRGREVAREAARKKGERENREEEAEIYRRW